MSTIKWDDIVKRPDAALRGVPRRGDVRKSTSPSSGMARLALRPFLRGRLKIYNFMII
jgi:hypothetical protein